MMIPLRTARLVVVFGGNATEMAHLLREDAIVGGLRPVMMLDCSGIEGNRQAHLLRRIALDMDTLIIVDAGKSNAARRGFRSGDHGGQQVRAASLPWWGRLLGYLAGETRPASSPSTVDQGGVTWTAPLSPTRTPSRPAMPS
jgi:hypothetical protein